MSKVSERPAVVIPTVEEDKAITVAAKADPDAATPDPEAIAGNGPDEGPV